MSTNWKAAIEADNAKRYILPAGFDTDESIGKRINMSAEKVRQHLAPLVKDRTAERRECVIWDKGLKRLVRVIAFRLVKTKIKA